MTDMKTHAFIAVSNDTTVGPAQGLHWTCGPEYARSHEHFSSVSAMVTAGGRVFYIIDEGPISSVYLPPVWKLVARDAFSGVLLWQNPITNWESQLRGFRSGGDPGFTEGRDLKTGEITVTIPAQQAWGHHRCYRNKATVNWLMVGRGGIQFIDPEIGGGYTHWPDVGNVVPAGRLLVFDGGKHIYGYGRLHYRMGDGHVRPNAVEDYKLFAEVLASEPGTRLDARGEERELPNRRKIQWAANLPFVARSLVLTRDALLVAGGASLTGSAETHGSGTFLVASREDGSMRFTCTLPAPPVLDGMALTADGVFVSTLDGSIACLRTKADE